MRYTLIIPAIFLATLIPIGASAQTACLAYPSNSTPPAGYGASWDVFSSAKTLLVKSNCPSSGNSVTVTVGKGDSSQFVWNESYSYNSGWTKHILSGTQNGGWIAGSGTANITAPATASTSSPLYFIGFVCTNQNRTWKCGCANAACVTPQWQLQAYTGIAAIAAVATPAISPNGATFATSQSVSLSTATAGATIRYTTNGSDPTAASTQYSAPFTVSQTTTVKARAFKSGMADSSVASAVFTKSAGGSANRSGLPWKSGSSPGTDLHDPAVEKVNGFGAWRGRPDDVAVAFISNGNWNETGSYAKSANALTIGPNGSVKGIMDAGAIPVLGVPVLTNADFMRFDLAASGSLDDEHQAIADRIAQAVGNKKIYIRVGWETDEGYPWSYTNGSPPGTPDADPSVYKASWRRIAAIYKNTVPNSVIVWNVLKNTRKAVRDYYPGDDLVDVISIDIYDGYGGTCENATKWAQNCLGSYNPDTGVSKGIGGILAFAKTRGKKIAVDEWGAVNSTRTSDHVSNNSYYVSAMFDFFMANKEWIEYESYFNRAGGGTHQIWPREEYNGNVSDAYLAKYRP